MFGLAVAFRFFAGLFTFFGFLDGLVCLFEDFRFFAPVLLMSLPGGMVSYPSHRINKYHRSNRHTPRSLLGLTDVNIGLSSRYFFLSSVLSTLVRTMSSVTSLFSVCLSVLCHTIVQTIRWRGGSRSKSGPFVTFRQTGKATPGEKAALRLMRTQVEIVFF